METIEGWKSKQRAESLFALREGGSPLLKFLEVGEGNRINPADQSRILIVLRMFGTHMGFDWIKTFCDFIENYQTTCGSPHAAREMLLSALQFTEWAGHDRAKTSLNLSMDGAKGK